MPDDIPAAELHNGHPLRPAQSPVGFHQAGLFVRGQVHLRDVVELAGEEVAKSIQLVLEYDPQPPFDSGSPEKAGPERVKRIRDRLAPMLEGRRKANAAAAANLTSTA